MLKCEQLNRVWAVWTIPGLEGMVWGCISVPTSTLPDLSLLTLLASLTVFSIECIISDIGYSLACYMP